MSLLEAQTMPQLPPPQPEGDNITKQCLHVRLKFEKLGNSRKVKTSQIDVKGETEENKTDKALIRVSKRLLDSPELKAIGTADSELKAYLALVCLPFDTGIRLVPKSAVEQVAAKLEIHAKKRELLVESFLQCYDSEVERAKIRLGPLFNAGDYPPREQVAREFNFYYEFVTFGPPAELQRLAPSTFAQEREKAAARLESAAAEIQQLMRATLADMVERLKVALTPTEDGKRRKLYDTTVTNLQDWLSTFDLRNVNNDEELAALVQKARDTIAGITTEQLKDGETLRVSVQKSMEEVSELLKPLVITPIRKMKLQ